MTNNFIKGKTIAKVIALLLTFSIGFSFFGLNNSHANVALPVGDFVWHDLNENGIQDPGEPGIGGITVTVKNLDWNKTKTTTTSDDGHYEVYIFKGELEIIFSDIPDGYEITKTNEGTDDEKDSDAVFEDDRVVIKGIDFRSIDMTFDLGLVKKVAPTYKLGDYVWYDDNKDGIQDKTEKGVNGVKVVLKDEKGNTLDEKNTDENGHYEFTGLSNGKYTVEFSNLPDGYEITKTNEGTDDEKDSDGLKVENVTIADADNMTIDLGLVEKVAPTYKLGDYVWYDDNKDGIQNEAKDRGVKGVTVTLTGGSLTAAITDTTDENGHYEFTGLSNGKYTVEFSNLPAGYERTKTNEGTEDTIDSDGLKVEKVTIENDDNMTIDLGIKKKSSSPTPTPTPKTYKLGNYVWYDDNKDGIQNEAKDRGVEGVKVILTKPDGKTEEVTTNSDGYYEFTGLSNGEYKVEFTNLPAGYERTKTNEGTDDTIDSDGLKVEKVTIADADNMTIDLGIKEKVDTEPASKPDPNPGNNPDPNVDIDNDGVPEGGKQEEKTENLPSGELPKTGGIPISMFFGLGSAAVLSGIIKRKNK